MSHRPHTSGPNRWHRAIVALLACAGTLTPLGPAIAQAQPEPQSQAQPAAPTPAPPTFTGKTFAGVRLPLAPVVGPIDLAATRAWTWAEEETIAGAAATATRVTLEGDVTIRLGPSTFEARRASLWLQPLGPGPSGGSTWQVYAVMEGVNTSTADAAVSLRTDVLPVQAVIELPAGTGIDLKADRRVAARPDAAATTAAEQRLARRLRQLTAPEPQRPEPISPQEFIRRGEPVPALVTSDDRAAEREQLDLRRLAEIQARLGPAPAAEPIFAKEGVFTFSAGKIEVVSGAEENAVILTGRAAVQYNEQARDRTLQLSAERVVVFLDPGPLTDLGRATADNVRGVYLEGDVQATDGTYNLRAPQVFYSVRDNRALLIDAVFWTYDQKRGLPLYVRAKSIAQESQNQFKATSARVMSTALVEPDLAIGASTVTVTRQPSRQGDQRLYIDARDVTMRAGGIPFFYWPVLKGEPDQVPLREVKIENSNASGTAFKTVWNLPVLLGRRAETDVRSDLMLDWYFERGFAVGTDTRWRTPTSNGSLFAYAVPNDTGKDVLPTGVRKDRDGEFRGMFTGEHRAQLADEWTLFAEGSYISDPTFIDGFFSPEGRTRREFTNALYVRRLADNTALDLGVKGTFNDFIPNQYLLQSQGYSVERLPSIGYARLADNLLPDSPGLLTYSSEYRFDYMRLRFDEIPARDRGFENSGQSLRAFGVLPGESLADALRRRGFTDSPVARANTRQQIDMPLAAGPVNITPFVSAQGTFYSRDFESYSPEADQQYRLWGGAGITASSEIQRVYNDARSRLLDVNRLRHIIVPSFTVFHGGATTDSADLPVYDPQIEQVQAGTMWRFAVEQTFQTQRGGPGRWRSVDLVTWDTELVVPSGDTDRTALIGTWSGARPEFSSLGETFLRTDAAWQVTEVLGLAGGVVYDFGFSQLARSNVGLTLQHTPEFSSFAELRSISTEDESFVNFGASYQLGRRYTISVEASYNTDLGEIQTISTDFRRRLPSLVVGASVSYDSITDRTSFGFVLQPLGFGAGSGAAVRGGSGAAREF